MKAFLFFTIFVCSQTLLFSQENNIRQDWWKTFSGELNGKEIAVSVNRGSDNRIVGSSCDLVKNQKVLLSGVESGNNLELTATINDSIIGVFKGVLTRLEDDFFKGVYTTEITNDSYPFKFKYSSGSWGTTEKRYMDFPGSDTQLETFAKDLIIAFQTNDKEWLSQNINYPLPIYFENKKPLEIKTPQEFKAKFEQIATKELLTKIIDWKTCNLFSNHSGVMLGRGEIWIWRDDAATDQDPKYRIKDIVTY